MIEVDLSHLWNTPSVQIMPKGNGVYYKVCYELVMLFGGTEIEAQLCWKENVSSTIFRKLLIVLGTDHTNCFLLYTFQGVEKR